MRSRGLKMSGIFMLSIGLTGCMVGPDFHSPRAPQTTTYTGGKKPLRTVNTPTMGKSGKTQHFLNGRDIPADWWRMFHSPELNRLIMLGFANNPNVAAARAALTQSQELLYAQITSTLVPNLNAQSFAQRQRFARNAIGESIPPKIFNLFNASVNVNYALDVFGGLRRQVEVSSAQVDFNSYELEAAYLTLAANIVTTAITTASLREQIEATEKLISMHAGILTILEKQFKLGAIAESDVLTQKIEVEQTRATLPPLQQSLAVNLHALSVLVGSLPREDQLPILNLDSITLPTHLPISIPSKLVRQRPDIQASEALLHAASARVGVATANMYPQITINANYGWEGNLIPNLFQENTNVWSIGTNLAQTIFDAGALNARRCASLAAFRQSYAQYQQTVLDAFKNVADVLRALENDARALRIQRTAEITARKSLLLTKDQYRLGATDYLNLLNAQRQYHQTTIARIRAEADRYTDTAALFQALGGGWWNQGCKYG